PAVSRSPGCPTGSAAPSPSPSVFPFPRRLVSAPPSIDALLARANLLRMRGQWADAVERCTEALRADPHNPAAHSLLGDIYENQGRVDKAIHWYQLALEQNPESV